MAEVRLQGVPVSEGIAIGMPHFVSVFEEAIPECSIALIDVEKEIARYRHALCVSREELEALYRELEGEAAAILHSHIQMLADPLLTTHMEEKIRERLLNAESVFWSVVCEYERKLLKSADLFFQERLVDVVDVCRRILGHLYPGCRAPEVPDHAILFSKELAPSQTASVHALRIGAFVTQRGGRHSHAALMARAKGIPYVSGIQMPEVEEICVIVDGQTGEVILNPSTGTLERYQQIKTRLKAGYQFLQKEGHHEAETIDGYVVEVFANISHLSELDRLSPQCTEGVGLFRSEYLFFQDRSLLFSEEGQHAAYLKLIRAAGDMPVVIRAFDVGGDKVPDLFFQEEKEPNPILGCRGIRFLLKHKGMFKTHLKAILRAAVGADVRLLLPLISDIGELRTTKQLLLEVEGELEEGEIPFKKGMPLGCMIEVPSAVLICDVLARESDFLSIGTNDLAQYTLGIDRGHPSMSDLCHPAHPSVIRMIKMVIVEAKRTRTPVTLCGEIASNPLFIPLLLGLGVQKISCAPRHIPVVKRAIRHHRLSDAVQIAEKVLQVDSAEQVFQTLIEAHASSEAGKREPS